MEDSCTLIIFGGTGDLVKRKLVPALHQLKYEGLMDEGFNLVSIGRRNKTQAEYKQDLFDGMVNYTKLLIHEESWEFVKNRTTYFQMDFNKPEDYTLLRNFLNSKVDSGEYSPNFMFYLAVGPENFGKIVNLMDQNGIVKDGNNWNRLIIEKPFGVDLDSAKTLNSEIRKVFKEDQIFRIDHYLGKEMIQNITMLRFQNAIFEPLWSNKFIDNVQIVVSELDGVGSRAGYYDSTGALRDMVQNHLLQTLAITAMDPPISNDPDHIRDVKVKLMSELVLYSDETVADNVLFGQYESYKNELNIPHDSKTETFVAMKLYIDNEKWRGVPFYLMTGKKLEEKTAQVTIEFKFPKDIEETCSTNEIFSLNQNSAANVLEIKIQPREGISLRLNTKKPAVINETVVAEMEYCQSCQNNFNTPDAYEKLLLDVMKGDSTRFTRWDELALSWYFIDSINKKLVPLYHYGDNSCGPTQACILLKKDDRKWWHLNKMKRGETHENL
ncbi:glucose-6-phosphate dehydrogenase [Alkalibacter mobilis]|uniref:glucose-6-phosphate dehydrogenase n=1 Tax=Alkalibacter mobilis TaxID=2787712 RepID=UPI00189DB993|nr:glucose-6-phosphate dehydrogenase [Alkalibacter mobilis]MBF7095736.1 glucose-6-phosphate dehydrogenase [Alkalibacter mobilis]